MSKVLCYCEMNDKTGFGHYNRIKILLKILNIRKAEIFTKIKKMHHSSSRDIKLFLKKMFLIIWLKTIKNINF